jgi:hypothetical protein
MEEFELDEEGLAFLTMAVVRGLEELRKKVGSRFPDPQTPSAPDTTEAVLIAVIIGFSTVLDTNIENHGAEPALEWFNHWLALFESPFRLVTVQ